MSNDELLPADHREDVLITIIKTDGNHDITSERSDTK